MWPALGPFCIAVCMHGTSVDEFKAVDESYSPLGLRKASEASLLHVNTPIQQCGKQSAALTSPAHSSGSGMAPDTGCPPLDMGQAMLPAV